MALYETMKAAAAEVHWAFGVRLARGAAVSSAGEDLNGLRFRVAVGAPRAPLTVHLWPATDEWSCECGAETDVCGHAAAAVIAWHQAARGIAPADAAPTPAGPRRVPATVGYRFSRMAAGLAVDRVAVKLGTETALRGPLTDKAPGGGPLTLSDADLDAERCLPTGWGAPLRREAAPGVLRALAGHPDLLLDGAPIAVQGAPVLPVVRVDDDPGGHGIRLRVVRDSAIEEVFPNGVVRCGGALRPVARGEISAERYAALVAGEVYGPAELPRLVGEVLPALRALLPVDVRTARLPTAADSEVRLVVETEGDGEVLVLRPRLLYGDPPVAAVERGELVPLGRVIPVRDRRAEDALVRAFQDETRLPYGTATRAQGAAAVRWVQRLGGARLRGEAWRRFRPAPPLQPQVHIDGDRLSVDFGGADPARVFAAWAAGDSMVPVAEGWAPLPVDWLEQFGPILADLLAAREPDGTVRRAAALDLGLLAARLNAAPPPSFAALAPLLDGFAGLPRATLPADLRATLRAYQQQGVDWLSFLRDAGLGGVLADDMGLGKTLQALCIVRGRTLVVAPASVLPNWEKEAARFRPGLRVHRYHGAARRLEPGPGLTLTTWGTLRADADALAAEDWDLVLLDEAQAIKNPESQVAQAAFRLRAAARFALTGTPIENRLDELWSQLHFALPGFLGGRSAFQERTARPVAAGDSAALDRLRARVRPFLLRRMKSVVAPELPPRTDLTLHVTLSADERAVYDAVRAATRAEVLRQLGEGRGVIAALEALLRLRQAACHSALVPGQSALRSSKIDLLVGQLEQAAAEGHKALVFSQWTSLLDRVEPALRAAGLDFARLDGSTRDRGAVVSHFQSADGPPVFLLSLQAGGTGLNLTAADHVFLLDPWWNPAVEDQAADRAHRIGQDKPVFVHRLVAEETVEERILALQERKRALAEGVLGGGGAVGGITREDLLALLE